MFILPYYIVKSSDTFIAWIFLESGKTLWKTNEKKITNKKIIEDYLTPNGFVGTCVCVKEDVLYFEVDPTQMKMSSFYTWTDFLSQSKPIPDIDIWRPFVWVEGEDYFWKDEIGHFSFLNSFWTQGLKRYYG